MSKVRIILQPVQKELDQSRCLLIKYPSARNNFQPIRNWLESNTDMEVNEAIAKPCMTFVYIVKCTQGNYLNNFSTFINSQIDAVIRE